MEKQVVNRFTWVIKDFTSLTSTSIYSDPFVVGGCKWRLQAYPKGNNVANNLALYLNVDNYKSLPSGWRRDVKVSFTIVNQIPCKVSQLRETQYCFGDHHDTFQSWGFPSMIPLTELNAKSGLMVNGEVKIVAEVDVLEVIGKLDVPDESNTATQPLKKIKLNDDVDFLKETLSAIGVQVLPSQLEYVSRVFEKHPEMTLLFRSKNPHLRTGYMNVLLSLTRTLCQTLQELSSDDMSNTGAALKYMRCAGFRMDWLEKKWEEVKEKKKKEETCLARLQEMEEQLQPLKQKCSDIEAKVDKEKAELLEIRAPLSFDN